MKFVKIKPDRNVYGAAMYFVVSESANEFVLTITPGSRTTFPLFKVHTFQDAETMRETRLWRIKRADKIGRKG